MNDEYIRCHAVLYIGPLPMRHHDHLPISVDTSHKSDVNQDAVNTRINSVANLFPSNNPRINQITQTYSPSWKVGQVGQVGCLFACFHGSRANLRQRQVGKVGPRHARTNQKSINDHPISVASSPPRPGPQKITGAGRGRLSQ